MLKQIVLLVNCLLVSQFSYAQTSAKSSGLTGAQSLQKLPNANFSQWTQGEPTSWYTNNVYNEQHQLQQALVVSAGATGARLLGKRVVYREGTPVVDAWYGGQLSSTLMPFMPTEGKPVALTIRYRFQPDSADVLRAEVQLESRNNEPASMNLAKACICQLMGVNGPISLSPTQTSVTLQAIFADTANPDKVPLGCAVYVWKVRFWLENSSTHPHEKTDAVIEQVALQP